MTTLLKKAFTTLLLTAIFLLYGCDMETTDTPPTEKNQSPLVGTWETEESFNLKKGFKYIYEINSNGKAAFSMEYISDVNPDGETVLIKKGEYLKVEGTASTTADKITITDMKVANNSTMSKEMIAQMIQEPLDDMEIEYKDLTQTSVKIKNVYCDDDGNEIEEWITLRKVTNTNSNNSNENNDTEYSIIGTWTNTQTADTIDGSSMEIKTTYVITADKITSYGEFNGQKSTYEMTITKIESGKIYCIGLSPVDNTTEVTSILMYKDLTADSVKIALYSIESDVWLTFTKVTSTNNNGDNNNTEYSIIGSWEGNYETTVMDGITMKMDATYTITDKSFTSTTKILEDVVIMDTLIYPAGHEQTSEVLITKIDTSAKLIGYKTTDPETNETKEDFIAYRNLTATTVEFMIPGMNGEPNWLTFTKVKM